MIVIVMGVVGAGKTTIGRLLAQELGWTFADADYFHPQANKEKMSNGIALSEADRQPWLDSLRKFLIECDAKQQSVVLACSALKRSYRDILQIGPAVRFVYMKGSLTILTERLRARQGHFTGVQILASQLADLEEPDDAVVVDIAPPPVEIVAEIRCRLSLG